MKKACKEALYARFAERMSAALGDRVRVLQEVGPKSHYLVLEYGRPPTPARGHFWFIVQQETFRVYCSWTTDGRFPATAMPIQSPIDIPELKLIKDEPKNGEFMFNAPLLWRELRPTGWDVSGMSAEAMLKVLDGAIDRVLQHAVPYFDQVLASPPG
jgi:hypothetical protein